MTLPIGLDTNWLVQWAVVESPAHSVVRTQLQALVAQGEKLALTPQVASEFVHIVTDTSRFARPLSMEEAWTDIAHWWNAPEVVQCFPTAISVQLGWDWMRQHRLGRKRVLDTQLAATFYSHGIDRILTTNARDFTVFGCFTIL